MNHALVMAQYVPHFVGHLIYVPHVPHMWDSCGTKTRSPRDGDKFTDFWIDWDFEVLLDRPFWTARFEPHARFGLRVPYPHLHPLLHPHLHSTTPRYLGTSVPQIMKSVVMAQYVPHFVGHLIYVPHVPHMWDSCGTKTRSPQDGDKFTDFWIDLMKI